MQIAPNYPGVAYNGSLTFAGVLRKCFFSDGEVESISKNWNEATQKRYIREYENIILPELKNMKPMHLYEEEDFIYALIKIKKRIPGCSEEYLNHFRYLLWRVYKVGADRGLYDDIFFWKDPSINDSYSEGEIENKKNPLRMIKKSFTVEEEHKILNWFKALDPVTVTGKEIGFAAMFFLGLRNQEACGLDYKAIKLLKNNNYPVVYIYQTTRGDNGIKAGGKTANAMRIIPMFDFFYEFIQRRRKFIEREISDNRIILEAGRECVDDLPIVCKNDDYNRRSQSNDLTRFAKNIFERLEIGGDAWEVLSETIYKQRLENINIGEKEPTAYLCRRNFATHLYCLGFSAGEIQYIIGHDVESPVETRNFFTNEDKLISIQKKLQAHPFMHFFNGGKNRQVILKYEPYRSSTNSTEHLVLKSSHLKERYMIQVAANEPIDEIEVVFDNDDGYVYSIIKGHNYNLDGYNQTVNIRDVINKNYL